MLINKTNRQSRLGINPQIIRTTRVLTTKKGSNDVKIYNFYNFLETIPHSYCNSGKDYKMTIKTEAA